MQLIRKKVFETNSSSCHSISIANTDNDKMFSQWSPDEEGNICLIGGEFGWEIARYNDPETKANYCVQSIASTSWDKVEDITYEENKLEMLKKVIKEQTGCYEVILNDTSINNGYIDHQSDGVANEAFYSKEALRNFIFNKNSYLYTDNDNH